MVHIGRYIGLAFGKRPRMWISVTDAKGQLTELVRRAEAGDEVVLTRHGQPAVRLVPVRPAQLDARRRRELGGDPSGWGRQGRAGA